MNNKKTASKGKILIVDDEIINIEYMNELLTLQDYDVVMAPTGLKCLQKLEKNPDIDLILMDIMMPGMDGFEVCEKIKSHERFKDIPIIFLTALGDEKKRIKGLKMGAVDYITKPFEGVVLEAKVHNHVSLKRANDKIKQLYDDLKEMEKIRDALSHMIVHDLRNPLIAIQGIISILQMSSDSLPKGINHKLLQIQGATNEMSNLINAILDISKMESKTMTISLVSFDATELAKKVTDEAKIMYDMVNVKLDLMPKSKNLKIKADKELVTRILKNLLSNALKFAPNDSSVKLTIEKIDNNAVFRVDDEGPGIPEEFREKIFDKFYQISSREVKKKVGVGLGLAFCRMAANAMNCKIWVEDRPDSKPGSSFCLALPITKN